MKKHLTQAEFARLRGVNKSTVTRWIQNGRMTTMPTGLIDPEQASRELDATESPEPHHQARKAQLDEARDARSADNGDPTMQPPGNHVATPQNAPQGAMPPIEQLGAALKMETYKLQKAKAEAANMEIDKMAGTLVERAEVDYLLADLGSYVRTTIEGVPDRYTGQISACRGDSIALHNLLSQIFGEILIEIADTITRKKEAITK